MFGKRGVEGEGLDRGMHIPLSHKRYIKRTLKNSSLHFVTMGNPVNLMDVVTALKQEQSWETNIYQSGTK